MARIPHPDSHEPMADAPVDLVAVTLCRIHVNRVAVRGRISLFGPAGIVGSRRPCGEDGQHGDLGARRIVVGIKRASQDHLSLGIGRRGPAGNAGDTADDGGIVAIQGAVRARSIVPIVAHIKAPVRIAA